MPKHMSNALNCPGLTFPVSWSYLGLSTNFRPHRRTGWQPALLRRAHEDGLRDSLFAGLLTHGRNHIRGHGGFARAVHGQAPVS